MEDLVKVGNLCVKVQLECFVPLLCASNLSCQLAACLQCQREFQKCAGDRTNSNVSFHLPALKVLSLWPV